MMYEVLSVIDSLGYNTILDSEIHKSKVHSLSSGKGEMFLCAACHAFTPHMNAWKN